MALNLERYYSLDHRWHFVNLYSCLSTNKNKSTPTIGMTSLQPALFPKPQKCSQNLRRGVGELWRITFEYTRAKQILASGFKHWANKSTQQCSACVRQVGIKTAVYPRLEFMNISTESYSTYSCREANI